MFYVSEYINGDSIMNIVILGGAGFIGTNLVKKLAGDEANNITVVDTNTLFFENIQSMGYKNVSFVESAFNVDTDFDNLVCGFDMVYHMFSTTVPTTANQHITEELNANVVVTSCLLEACVRQNVHMVVFISSGGTVYGKETACPLKEETPTYPICSYGIQKITIEKLLYLYRYMHGLDYRIIRLANPYGPYQRPNGILGAVTTFTHKALYGEDLVVYGDGSVVRDFIYIDDAIRAIENITKDGTKHKTYNVGSGYGTSIRQVVETIKDTLDIDVNIRYQEGRKADVPVNYLDISRYEVEFGKLNPISLQEGIKRTADFMRENSL